MVETIADVAREAKPRFEKVKGRWSRCGEVKRLVLSLKIELCELEVKPNKAQEKHGVMEESVVWDVALL